MSEPPNVPHGGVLAMKCRTNPYHELPLISDLDIRGMTQSQVIAEFKALFEEYGYEDIDTSYVIACFEVIEQAAHNQTTDMASA